MYNQNGAAGGEENKTEEGRNKGSENPISSSSNQINLPLPPPLPLSSLSRSISKYLLLSLSLSLSFIRSLKNNSGSITREERRSLTG